MLLIDKPLDWTSQDVCAKLKRTLDVKKIGHAGTLDPSATGLLVVCIGKGTKSSERLMASEKVYTGTMRLGQATPSYDADTEPCAEAPWEHVTDGTLQEIARERFTGDIMQVCAVTITRPVDVRSPAAVLVRQAHRATFDHRSDGMHL